MGRSLECFRDVSLRLGETRLWGEEERLFLFTGDLDRLLAGLLLVLLAGLLLDLLAGLLLDLLAGLLLDLLGGVLRRAGLLDCRRGGVLRLGGVTDLLAGDLLLPTERLLDRFLGGVRERRLFSGEGERTRLDFFLSRFLSLALESESSDSSLFLYCRSFFFSLIPLSSSSCSSSFSWK